MATSLLGASVAATGCGGSEPVYVRDSARIPPDAQRYAGPSGYPRMVEAGTDEECPEQTDTTTYRSEEAGTEAIVDGEAVPEEAPSPCVSREERERQELLALAAEGSGQADEEPTNILATHTGRASYYSDALAGRRTANGERYDPTLLTAASRDLPFDTIVRVTRLDTGEHVVVRINDRGPFGDRRRILDLSRAAAERLHMLRAGVIDIRADIIARPE